ncbi:MAG: D-alanine--D-alanine ligase [Hyphomicrobiaceae bacterium]
MTRHAKRKFRVILLADERLLPRGDIRDLSEKQRELRKTEFDVLEGLKALGHEVWPIGVYDELSAIRGAIDAHKPHIAFNLVEEFDGIGQFDQHVVSYLELRKQPYTGCNPRGLTLSRDKGITKKLLAYEGLSVPDFAVFPLRRRVKRPPSLAFPLFVKSLTEEGSAGISNASIVHDDAKLLERVEFIHRTIKSPAIVEQYIEGREIYVGVMGNDRPKTLPPWEFSMLDRNSDQPLIASDRAKWDPQYQRQLGLKTGPAKLNKKMADKLASLSTRIYRLLDMSGYARLDYRVTDEGQAYLLEANPNPQIARDEDFAESARHIHISYEELLQRILDVGLRYQPSRNLV